MTDPTTLTDADTALVESMAQAMSAFDGCDAAEWARRADDGSMHDGLFRNDYRRLARLALDAYRMHTLSDSALLAAYQRTTGEPGDAEADALLDEIRRRDLDI